jgi:uncharacterized protein
MISIYHQDNLLAIGKPNVIITRKHFRKRADAVAAGQGISLMEWVLPVLAVFVGAFLNAVAGGGSLITLAVLVMVGVTPTVANATGTAALFVGYVSSLMVTPRLESVSGIRPIIVSAIALLGGALGGTALLLSTERLFEQLIPLLLAFGTLLFAFAPRLGRLQSSRSHSASVYPGVALLLISTYGGYFNGGVGILLMSCLTLFGVKDVVTANYMKNLISALLTAVALAVYQFGGLIEWRLLVTLLPASLIGGFLGGRAADRISPAGLRWTVIVAGCAMTVYFALRS